MTITIGILLCMGILFFANWIQGVSGFGRGLIAIPLLSFFIPIDQVIPMMILTSILTTLLMYLKNRESTDIRKILPMSLLGIVGTTVGVALLKALPVFHLKIIIGILIMLFAILIATGFSIRVKRMKLAFCVTGFISGFLSGSLSIGGPPVVFLFQGIREEKDAFRGNLSLFFLIVSLFSILNLFLNGMVSGDILWYSLVFMPVILLGTLAGHLFSRKVNEIFFRKLVTILLFLSGMSAVFFALV
ncbi:MAG: sulfite exporter TauE/SafE family protein [Clostridia bacterium]